MTKAVGDLCYQVVGTAYGVAEEAVDGPDHDLYEVDVLPFVEAADVVGLGNLSFMED